MRWRCKNSAPRFKSWTKDESSPVSEVDIEVDEFLHRRLAASIPKLRLAVGGDRGRSGAAVGTRVWIVDPIDGTRGFIAGLADWTVVAALVEDGRPISAAVYAPVDDQLFLAEAGGGTTLNGVTVAVRAGDALEGARVNGAKRRLEALAAFVPGDRDHSADRFARLAPRARRRRPLGYRAERRPEPRLGLAASDLLVHEAGGVLSDIDGRRLVYNRPEPVHGALMAAGRARHAALLNLVRDRNIKFV